MTERDVIIWIRKELGPVIRQQIKPPYTEDWLGAMVMREVGELLSRYIPQNNQLQAIAPLMRGDYGRRPGELEKQYHGYGFWQIDIGSFPQFVKSGAWKDPVKCCQMAIDVLDGKRAYLTKRFTLSDEDMNRAICSAYNCGEGNVSKALIKGLDVDHYTANGNYSKDVWRIRQIYTSIGN